MTTEQGFAVRRNGSCLSGYEIDCGQTLAPFRGCCPTGFECPSQYNVACCPPGNNCTNALLPEPKCSNSTWDLFDNKGYFCCEHGLPGYNTKGTDGCASPGYQFKGGEEILSTIQAGQASAASSVTRSSSSTSSSAATTSTTSTESSTPVGAIAGGVVGGIAAIAIIVALIWFILRRKRQNKLENPYLLQNMGTPPINDHGTYVKHQLDENQIVHEADGAAAKYASLRELPANQVPAELPASQRSPT